VKEALLGSTWLAGQPIEIWFQDEARVGQKGGHAYIWAEKGSRPLMVRNNRHDSAYLLGAICPARAVGAAIIMPTVNAEAMSEHLKEIGAQVARGAHAMLVVDGAGWHQTGGKLIVPDNITLLPLPPYAVEPDGERLGILARQQTLRPGVGHIRSHRPGMPGRVEVSGR